MGRRKYNISRTMLTIRIVGPMMTAWRRREREKLNGRRRTKVIIEVGRNRTARDARIREMDRLLRLVWIKGVRYRLEWVDWWLESEGQGQYKNAPAVTVVSREFENVRVSVNQFHTDVTVQNNCA